MRKAGVLTSWVLAPIIALGVWTAVRAGTLPDISGTWYPNGSSFKTCQIQQAGDGITLLNERGQTATGSFVTPSQISTNWSGSMFPVTGSISSDLRTITWSNGTYWTRGSSYTPATSAPVATPNPYRSLNFTIHGYQEHGIPPMLVWNGWGAASRNLLWAIACISFENQSKVVATNVRFEFPLVNSNGTVLGKLTLDRKGTFSPNVEIHAYHSLAEWQNKVGPRGYAETCAGWHSDNEEEKLMLLHAHTMAVRIERIDYADGTSWPAPSPGP